MHVNYLGMKWFLGKKWVCEKEYMKAWFLTTGERSYKYRKGEEARINPAWLDWNWKY